MTINYQFGDVDAHGAMIRALNRPGESGDSLI
ncbi:ESAT-6 like protein ESXI [Mycobacterium tuberculosis]|nr:ESAT-6 like protein ESXI [Mycobacterium tuberculosis]